MTEYTDINIGVFIKKVVNPGRGKIGIVVSTGADKRQTILKEWVRVKYKDGGGYEWIQKRGLELITNS